jgi:hypothetical protein
MVVFLNSNKSQKLIATWLGIDYTEDRKEYMGEDIMLVGF